MEWWESGRRRRKLRIFGDGVLIHRVNLETSCDVIGSDHWIGLPCRSSFTVTFPLTDNMAASREATVFFFAILFTVEENTHCSDLIFAAIC